MRFADERDKEQPKRPPELRGPPPRWRTTPEGQKYQAAQTQFITESRDQFNKKFDPRLAAVFSQLQGQEIDVKNVQTMCSANIASSPESIRQCGARVLVFSLTM